MHRHGGFTYLQPIGYDDDDEEFSIDPSFHPYEQQVMHVAGPGPQRLPGITSLLNSGQISRGGQAGNTPLRRPVELFHGHPLTLPPMRDGGRPDIGMRGWYAAYDDDLEDAHPYPSEYEEYSRTDPPPSSPPPAYDTEDEQHWQDSHRYGPVDAGCPIHRPGPGYLGRGTSALTDADVPSFTDPWDEPVNSLRHRLTGRGREAMYDTPVSPRTPAAPAGGDGRDLGRGARAQGEFGHTTSGRRTPHDSGHRYREPLPPLRAETRGHAESFEYAGFPLDRDSRAHSRAPEGRRYYHENSSTRQTGHQQRSAQGRYHYEYR